MSADLKTTSLSKIFKNKTIVLLISYQRHDFNGILGGIYFETPNRHRILGEWNNISHIWSWGEVVWCPYNWHRWIYSRWFWLGWSYIEYANLWKSGIILPFGNQFYTNCIICFWSIWKPFYIEKKTVIWSHPGEMSLGWYRGTEQWPKSKKRCGKSCWKLDYWRAACGESSHLSSRTNWKIIRSPLGAAKRVLCSDLEFKSGWIRSCPLANVKLFKTPCTHNDITAATHHPFLVTTGAVTPFPHLSNHKVADVGDLDSEWTCHEIKVFFPAKTKEKGLNTGWARKNTWTKQLCNYSLFNIYIVYFWIFGWHWGVPTAGPSQRSRTLSDCSGPKVRKRFWRSRSLRF